MRNAIIGLIIILNSTYTFSQNDSIKDSVLVMGRLYNYTINSAKVYGWCICQKEFLTDSLGKFQFKIPKENLLELKYGSFGFKEISIINISSKNDSINLGLLPLFEDEAYIHTDYFSQNIWSKIFSPNRISKSMRKDEEESKKRKEFTRKSMIEYNYLFEGRRYSINTEYNTIDLLIIE